MKNILIIYPHWPPSNLAGVHRARLISNFLHAFDWHPIVLTVKSQFYEEKLDFDIEKTVNPKTEIIYTNAKSIKKPRIIGDIGLRAFPFLKQKALEIINERQIDFIWIPIPSFYTAILGRILHDNTGIKYGIDYIDPWVRDISNRKNFRAVLSNVFARILEPFAVKKASLISGVSFEYFKPVLDRNFKNRLVKNIAMPYGFDAHDHKIKIDNINFPWESITDCKPIVYAGAFLPLSGYFTQLFFKSIRHLRDEGRLDKNIKFFFIGTGNYTHKSITEYAQETGISDIVVEIRDRFPYLHILNFLSNSFGNIIIGSTEKHYTASKTFQVLLSEKPVFSIFHNQSSAVQILNECNADKFTVKYDDKEFEDDFFSRIKETFYRFETQSKSWKVDLSKLEKYSAKESARILVEAINKVI